MASYTVNRAAMARAQRQDDSRRYVRCGNWGEVAPTADDENEFFRTQ